MRPYNSNPPIKVCHATTCYWGDYFRITSNQDIQQSCDRTNYGLRTSDTINWREV
ncbi:MAG: hypothetical protein RID53_23480 [Coleofasciculus sp. B1-GNL1-01]|uniref:hypothetical protein n=1 Tax=Coleofasciculus TaxID=669368 RepID=UPI0002F6C6FE|nr:hypothetical protein [Coleofasciculus chthonoplastes]